MLCLSWGPQERNRQAGRQAVERDAQGQGGEIESWMPW